MRCPTPARLLACVVSAGLALAALTVQSTPADAAPVAQVEHRSMAKAGEPAAPRKRWPTIALTAQQGQWDLSGPVAFAYQQPVLKGASRKARTAFAAAFSAALDRARTGLATLRAQSGCTTPGTFAATSHVGILDRRYASVIVDFALFACEGAGVAAMPEYPDGYTLDLRKKGKPVAPTTFVSNQYGLRDETVKQALYSAYAGSCETGTQLQAPLPAQVVWGVSRDGLDAHFPKYAVGPASCGVMAAHVPWRLLATPRDARGRERVGYYGLADDYCGQTYCGLLTVRAKGDVVWGDGFATGKFGWVGLRHGREGTVVTLGDGAGEIESLRFATQSAVSKPDIYGDDWVRITREEAVTYFPATG